MRLTIIGCSGSFPGPDSPASCYLVEAEGFRLLVDLGSGALGVLQRYARLDEIDAIWISHLHADHCLDLCCYSVARTWHPDGPRPGYRSTGRPRRPCGSDGRSPPIPRQRPLRIQATGSRTRSASRRSRRGPWRSARSGLICHLAAQIDVRVSVAAPAEDAQANVVGTVNVLEAARAADARVLFCSIGGALYGRDAPIPSLEDVLPLPESPYGIAKYCAEQYVGLYNRLHGTRHTILRLANVYGPRQDPSGGAGVIPIFCGRVLAGERPVIYGDGTQTRDYVYVGDAVAAFLAAADQGRPGIWNFGTGIESSVLDLARLIGEAVGRAVDPQFAPARPGELQRSALAAEQA